MATARISYDWEKEEWLAEVNNKLYGVIDTQNRLQDQTETYTYEVKVNTYTVEIV